MIRYKSLRLLGTAVSAAVVFFFFSACLVSEIAAQSAESAVTGSSLSSPAPAPFLVAPSIPLGYAPSGVATGDLRRSGKLDLVTADYNSGKVTVFLGAGQGKFAPGAEYDAGPHPSAVLVADMNGDGRPDVLVSNESEGTISLLLGNGDGTLQLRQSYTVGFNSSFIATGDFNGSGKLDLAVAGKSGNLLAILLNDGNGNLQKPVLRSLSKTPTALTVADFNNDGHADLAVANADGTVSLLLGKGAGLFRSLPDIPVASGPLSSINSGDLNRDGKIDLVVTQPGQKLVSVLIGRGDGTFASPASYPVGNEPVSTLVADVNGDGVPALVVINRSSNTFSILGGNGDGTFKTSVDFVAGNAPLAAVAGDFYGNGHADLAIINHSSQTVSVPPGYGDGTFKAARSYPSGGQPVSIASGNLSGGKIPALVVANYCGSDPTCGTAGNVAVFLADDKGAYRLSSTYPVGSGPVSVALADLTGDKNLDIVALNRLDKTASVMLSAGDGTFRQPMTFSLAGAPVAIAVGDLNKDGKPDLAVLEDCGSAKCSQAGSVEILLGAGDGSFLSASSYPVGYSPVSIAVGAIRGGKNLDLVVANRCGKDASCLSAGTATVLIGNGTGIFKPGTDVALGNSPSSVALGNLTGSGLDLVVSRSTDNAVAVLRGNGDGTFQKAVPYAVGNQPGSLVVADFNGDGKADVAVANVSDSTVSILFGKGDGTLQLATALAVGSGPTSLTAVGRINTRHASLATTNGNGGSSSPGTDFTVLPNLGTDPPLFSFVLVPSPTPASNVNQGVLLTATLTGVSPNPAPSGTVTFDSDPGTGAAPLTDCTGVSITQGISPSLISTATCTTKMLTAGSDSLTAVYSGDAVYDTGVGETSPAVAQTVNALSPTLALTTSSSSTSVNQSVTFTATLGGVSFTPITPTGSVNFTVGTGATPPTIGTCGTQALSLVAGVWTATCTTTSLALGANQTIGAVYTGDTNFKTATAATISQSITQATPTLTFQATTPGTSTSVNQSVTFTATLGGVSFTPTTPTGSVNFTVGTGATPPTIGTCGTQALSLVAGVWTATCTTTSLALGANQTIGAVYTGDTNFKTATAATISQSVVPFAATINVTGPGTVPVVNTPVTLTAQLAGTGIAFTPTAPSGKFIFSATINGTPTTLCAASGVLVSATGGASCQTSLLSAPSDAISVTYSGDPNFTTAAAGTMTQTVNALTPTLGLSYAPSSVSVGTSVKFTAQLSGVLTPVNPTGSVTFTINGVTNSDCPIPVLVVPSGSKVGSATCTTSSLVYPADSIVATYSGDSSYVVAASATVTPSVTKVAAATTLTSLPLSPAVNQAVVLTATVLAPGGATAEVQPSGSVTFMQGSTTLCGAAGIGSTTQTATCNYVFNSAIASPGSTITATYSGDQNFTAGTPGSFAEIVTAASTTTSVVSSPNPSAVNQQVTFTATVTPAYTAGTAKPAGTVVFTNKSTTPATTLCTETLSGGTAPVCTYTFTSPGSNDVVATYTSGDTNFTGSTSGATADVQVVNSGNTSVSLTSSLNPSFVNQAVTFNATINFPAGTSVPTGTVTYLDGATALPGCVFAGTVGAPFTGGTVPACTVPLLTQGTHSITAKYSGDSNFTAATSGAVSQVVNSTATTTTVVSSPNPSAVNAQVTFTATVTPAYSGATKPTGTVAFTNTSTTPVTTLCTETLSVGTVPVCNYTFTSSGSNNVVATYTSSDTNFSGSASGATADVQSVGAAATSVALASLPTSSTVNQAVTFTATITYTSGTSTPTGTVAFTFSGPQTGILCSSASVSTVASVTSATCTAPLPASGTYTVTAAYSGDTNFAGSSKTLSQLVKATATTTGVVASPSTLSVNQPVTFTATVMPAISYFSGATTPTGTVNFSYSLNGGASASLCSSVSVNTASGVTTAQCPGQALPTAGSYTITALYSGDANFVTSTGTAPQTVAATSTTTSLVSSPNPSAVNQQVTFTARLTPAYPAATKPTGTVVYSNTSTTPATQLCSVALTGGTVPVCNYTFTSSGAFNVVATYTSGDTNFTGSASGATADVQTVGSGATSVTLTSSPSPSFVNQQVTFNATINFVTSGGAQPTGTVTYLDGATTLCTFTGTVAAPFTGGSVPPCTVPLVTQGPHPITASYSGDSNFLKYTGSLSQTVNSTTTTTTVVSSPNPSAVNAQVTFTATVTPAYSGATKPTGTVAFTNTSTTPVTTLCTETLSVGTVPVCTYTFTSSGTYDVVATYTSGDTNFIGSASGATADAQAVGSGATSVAVTQLPASVVNQQVTFTATVNFVSTGKAVPTGTVTFTDGLAGATPLPASCTGASVTANGAGTAVSATCTASLFMAGTHPITAVYSGDSNFHTSTSPIMNQVVNQAATTAKAAGPSNASVNQSVTFTATVAPTTTPPAGYIAPTGTVTFSYTLSGGTSVPLCSATAYSLAAASATGCVTALPSNGTYSVIATYSGDSNYLGSAGALAVTVGATATTLSVASSSANNSVAATQNVTFTATVSQAGAPGSSLTSPTGSVAFWSSDISAAAPNGTLGLFCPSVTVNAVVGGFATAPCSVSFPPTTGGMVVVKATFTPANGNLNFLGSSTVAPQLTEVVQDFSIAFSAPASGAPVFLTQGFSNATDPLTRQTITVALTTAGTFSDQLTLSCTVTNSATNTPVTDPSCSVSPAYFSPTTATSGTYDPSSTTVTVTASTAAPLGSYTVALAALDSKVPTLSQTTATPVTVYVVGVSTGLTLAPGATGTASALFNTATPPSGKAPTTLGSFACGTLVQFVNGEPVEKTLESSTGRLTCSGPGSVTVTGSQTTVPISITPVQKTAQVQVSSTITLAAFLGVPFLALMGWVGSRKSPRRNFFRFLGLILLIVGLSYGTGCGTGFTPPTQPPGSVLTSGSYYVQLVATDQNGVQYFAAVPLTVNQ